MNITEVKRILNSNWYIDKQLEAEYKTIAMLRAKAAKSTPSYSLVASGGGVGQKVESCVLDIVDMEAKSKATVQRLMDAKIMAMKLIELLPEPRLKQLLKKRYLHYEKWEQIAVELNCSYRRIHQLHSKALQYIARNSQ